MKTSEVLKQAKQLIINPENWIQGEWSAKNRTCFCGLGAVVKTLSAEDEFDITVCGNDGADYYLRLAALQLDEYHDPLTSFAPYNDSHTHEEVLHAFDVAIQLAEKDEL